MVRGEILMKAGVVKVVKSIMLSTRNQNGREVGRVASKNTQRERNREGKTSHSCLSFTRPGVGPFICKSGT